MVKSVRRVQGKKEDILYILTLGLRALSDAFMLIIRKSATNATLKNSIQQYENKIKFELLKDCFF